MATVNAARWSSEVDVEIDEPRTGQVSELERSPAAAPVEVPPDVADDDVGEVFDEPRCVDEGPESRRRWLHAGNLRATGVVEPPGVRFSRCSVFHMITTDSAKLFFALLTLVANVAVLAGAGLWLAARWSKGAALVMDDVQAELTRLGVPVAFAVAATAMAGSLYFSEVANFVPCTLCWYQRIAMYSLAIILLVAVIRRDRNIRPYGMTLALVGLPVSIYHYLVEWYPNLETNVCSTGLSCSIVWFRSLGFMSLAYMAGSGFALIALVLALTPKESA